MKNDRNEERHHSNAKLSDEELEGISAAGAYMGTDGDDYLKGTMGVDYIRGGNGDDFLRAEGGNDVLDGGDGNDCLNGGGGADIMDGGGGDDLFDGGQNDRADDLAFGESGDDNFHTIINENNGNDFFDGGTGRDGIVLHNVDSIQSGLGNGDYTIELTDAAGNAVPITPDMFDENGYLQIPEGVGGVITMANGSTLTFTNVEFIKAFDRK